MLVDTGLPGCSGPLMDAIADLGRTPGDVTAVVLTHGHFDHVGTARRLAARWDLPVLAPELDVAAAGAKVGAGALTVRGVPSRLVTTLDATTPLPAGALVVPTPGHTAGHVALHWPTVTPSSPATPS